jgi:microcystin-dependent protein
MADIVKGHTFVSGEVVEAQSLNDLVGNAVIQPTLISEKVLKDPAAMSDRILIEDSGALKGITIQQIIDLVTPRIVNSAVPIGTVCNFAGANAPTGWFLCQGQQIDRDTYSDLFAIIGTTYGTASAATFNLPDCRGRVIAAIDAGAGRVGDPAVNIGLDGNVMGSGGGRHINVLTVNELAVHSHTASTSTLLPIRTTTQEGGPTYGLVSGGPFAGRVMIAGSMGDQTGQSTTSIGTAGGGQAHNNVQPTIMMQIIIKALNA